MAVEPASSTLQDIMAAADLRRAVMEFIPIYAARPIPANIGGMRFNHSFATWFILRELRPRCVIESGVWQGHSTWLIEQACPQAELYCLDLDFSRVIFRSPRARYVAKDFADCAFPGVDPKTTVCLFDDHQNAYARLKDLRWAGFTRAIFDDNFARDSGDCYSLRQVMAGSGHERIQMSAAFLGDAQAQQRQRMMETALWSIRPRQQLLVRANTDDRDLLARNCREYVEFPPAALSPHNDEGRPWSGVLATPAPIFGADDLPARLQQLMAADAREFDYINIAFVELNEGARA